MELFRCLDAVERDAAGALDREQQPNLFDRLSWYRLLEQHCPPPGELLVARAEDGRGARSWLFLSVRRRRAEAYANWYSFRFGAVHELVPEVPGELDAAIAESLRRHGLAVIHLYPLGASERLCDAFAQGGWRIFQREASTSWLADVAGLDFDEYWRSRPARLRNTGDRRSRADRLVCHVYNEFDAEQWTAYEEVYAASWKPEEGSPEFLRALAKQEGAAGTLRLGIARLNGRPVAAQLWLVENGRATIHKLAYRQDASQHSPGTVLSMAMFRHAIDVDRVEQIDFGLGDEPHKAEWMDRSELMMRMSAYNLRTFAGAVGAARETATTLVRRLRNN